MSKTKNFFKNKVFIIFIGILLLGAVLRFYHLPQNVSFDFDQEFAATFAQIVTRQFPIRLIGQALSIEGLFDGPFYFYLMTPFFLLTHLHPLGGFVGSAIFGLVIITTYFFVFRQIFGDRAALLAAFVRSILFVRITQDLGLNPAFSSELLVVLSWYFLYKWWHGKDIFLLPLAFTFGMFTSIHPVLFPFYIAFIPMMVVRRKIPSLKILLGAAVLFVIPAAPLLAFEYFRKFTEIKTLLSVHNSEGVEKRSIQTIVDYATLYLNYPISLLGINLPKIFQLPFGALVWGLMLLAAFRKLDFWKDKFHFTFLLSTIFAFTLYYYILPTHSPQYHFLGVEVAFFIYFLATLSIFFKKYFIIPIAVAILLFVFNFQLLVSFWNRPYRTSLYDKDKIVSEIAKRSQGKTKMEVYFDSEFGLQYGLGYLERYYGINPAGGGNTVYRIVIPTKSGQHYDLTSGNVGLLVEHK